MRRELTIDQPFNLATIQDSVQDFRWRKLEDGWYSGVLNEHLVHIRQSDRGIEYLAESDLTDFLSSYFRLDDDIKAIYADISSRDSRVARLVRIYSGLRVLRQPNSWECMASYICSARSRDPRTKKNVEAIAKRLGRPVELAGEVRYTFPTPEEVVAAGVGPLKELRLGLERHDKVYAGAKRICDGQLDLDRLAEKEVPYAGARWQLKQCYGIGDKIADCISLFTLSKMEAFPVDVWVQREVSRCSSPPPQNSTDGEIDERKYKVIAKWARDRFGKYAGYANQFLFHGH